MPSAGIFLDMQFFTHCTQTLGCLCLCNLPFLFMTYFSVTWKGRTGMLQIGRQVTLATCDRHSYTASFFIKHEEVSICHHYWRIKIQHSLGMRENMKKEGCEIENSVLDTTSLLISVRARPWSPRVIMFHLLPSCHTPPLHVLCRH